MTSTACRKYGDMLPQSTRSAQRSFWKLIDEAPETHLALLDVGVDELTDVTAGQLHIGQQLSLIDWLLTHPLHLRGPAVNMSPQFRPAARITPVVQ